MSPITIPVLAPTDMVTEIAGAALVCLAFWCWALSRLFNLSMRHETETSSGQTTDASMSLVALGISAPIAYYLLWLLTTPPTVISSAGVTGGAGPPYYSPTTIRWSDVTALRCEYTFWNRPRARFGLSVQSRSAKIWIGRMDPLRAEQLLDVMQVHVSRSSVGRCPASPIFPWSNGPHPGSAVREAGR